MNFSLSNEWINSLVLRYDIDKLLNANGIYFYKENNQYICQHYFDFDLNKAQIKAIKKLIENDHIIKFKYINEDTFKKINDTFKNDNITINIVDRWEAPLLRTKDIKDYILASKHNQLKRNYKEYLNNMDKYVIKNSSEEPFFNLWQDVLKIDYNSWKKEENSDMKSLGREDLQYLPYCILNPQDSNLNVLYSNNNPVAYSLMMKGKDEKWYAVKWGASYDGRKIKAGFYCLFNHLEHLNMDPTKEVNIDFWGRRNRTYDELKNNSIYRYHIELLKKE